MKPLFILLLVSGLMQGQVNFTSSNLPIVVINTNSQTIQDTVRIIANMGIIYNGPGNRNYMTDPFNHYNGKISIEIRGSTSQQYPKKSYGLETQDNFGNNLDTALLGMPRENDWILYGAYPDKTLMRNEICYDLFRDMGRYCARYHFVELVINGQYRGVYSFMEKLKRDKNRIDVSKVTPADTSGDQLTGGYIMKVDKLTGSSNTIIQSPYNVKVKYLYHDPEDTELLTVQQNYIKNYILNFENVMWGSNFANPTTGYPSLIEPNSFIDFMLMQELGRTVDGYRSSSFLYKKKDSKGGLLHAGPMWDFNLSYGNANYCDAFDTTGWRWNFNTVCPNFSSAIPFWWNKFLQDTSYTHLLRCRWEWLRLTVLHTDSMNARIDSLAAKLNESRVRNFQQWPILGVYVNWNHFVGNTWQEELDYLKWWFKARSEWMDQNVPGYCWNLSVPTTQQPVSGIITQPNPAAGYFYLNWKGNNILTGGSVQIMDVQGKTIYSKSGITESPLLIETETWSPGLYFIRVQGNDGKSYSVRLVSVPR